MAIINKYEITIEGKSAPEYIQSHGMEIGTSGVAIFYDIDPQGDKEIIYAYSPAFWNQIKLVD
jgi:hypothetical protein